MKTDDGKIHYRDFIRTYEQVDSSSESVQAKRFFKSNDEALRHIAAFLQSKVNYDFGSVLSSCDL